MNAKKIGIAIADDQEYLPFVKYFSKYPVTEKKIGGFTANVFDMGGVEVIALWCGIGKVNAACAATTLIHVEHCDIILNEGLSGGIQVSISSFIVSERFVEHDFDLTPIGYEIGKKPGEDMFIEADKELLALAENLKCAKMTRGTLGSGDGFVTDPNKTAMYIEKFNETACDMETAAIASVCKRNSVPFLAIRKVSDNANDESNEAYNEMNNKQEADLSVVIEELILAIKG